MYKIFYKGSYYEVAVNGTREGESFPIFIDTNSNGIYDESEVMLTENPSQLTVSKVSEAYEYEFKKGFNFVSFPMVMSDNNTSLEFLNYVNGESDNSLYSISKFEGTWVITGSNGESYDVDGFQLVPGKGYLVKSKKDFSITLMGKEVLFEESGDETPIALAPGWNLIGLYGSNVKSYTAESLIDAINVYSEVDFTADNVTKWTISKARYEGLQKENDDQGTTQVYGFDYPLNLQQAYFVKVTTGSGNWNPDPQ